MYISPILLILSSSVIAKNSTNCSTKVPNKENVVGPSFLQLRENPLAKNTELKNKPMVNESSNLLSPSLELKGQTFIDQGTFLPVLIQNSDILKENVQKGFEKRNGSVFRATRLFPQSHLNGEHNLPELNIQREVSELGVHNFASGQLSKYERENYELINNAILNAHLNQPSNVNSLNTGAKSKLNERNKKYLAPNMNIHDLDNLNSIANETRNYDSSRSITPSIGDTGLYKGPNNLNKAPNDPFKVSNVVYGPQSKLDIGFTTNPETMGSNIHDPMNINFNSLSESLEIKNERYNIPTEYRDIYKLTRQNTLKMNVETYETPNKNNSGGNPSKNYKKELPNQNYKPLNRNVGTNNNADKMNTNPSMSSQLNHIAKSLKVKSNINGRKNAHYELPHIDNKFSEIPKEGIEVKIIPSLNKKSTFINTRVHPEHDSKLHDITNRALLELNIGSQRNKLNGYVPPNVSIPKNLPTGTNDEFYDPTKTKKLHPRMEKTLSFNDYFEGIHGGSENTFGSSSKQRNFLDDNLNNEEFESNYQNINEFPKALNRRFMKYSKPMESINNYDVTNKNSSDFMFSPPYYDFEDGNKPQDVLSKSNKVSNGVDDPKSYNTHIFTGEKYNGGLISDILRAPPSTSYETPVERNKKQSSTTYLEPLVETHSKFNNGNQNLPAPLGPQPSKQYQEPVNLNTADTKMSIDTYDNDHIPQTKYNDAVDFESDMKKGAQEYSSISQTSTTNENNLYSYPMEFTAFGDLLSSYETLLSKYSELEMSLKNKTFGTYKKKYNNKGITNTLSKDEGITSSVFNQENVRPRQANKAIHVKSRLISESLEHHPLLNSNSHSFNQDLPSPTISFKKKGKILPILQELHSIKKLPMVRTSANTNHKETINAQEPEISKLINTRKYKESEAVSYDDQNDINIIRKHTSRIPLVIKTVIDDHYNGLTNQNEQVLPGLLTSMQLNSNLTGLNVYSDINNPHSNENLSPEMNLDGHSLLTNVPSNRNQNNHRQDHLIKQSLNYQKPSVKVEPSSIDTTSKVEPQPNAKPLDYSPQANSKPRDSFSSLSPTNIYILPPGAVGYPAYIPPLVPNRVSILL